jgi:hypothetical protein
MEITMKIDLTRYPTLKKVHSIATLNRYQLPGNPEKDVYCIGLSGGIDSSALAIVMCSLFPDVDIQLVNTDTSAEVPGTYESLANIEKFTGKKIIRITQEDGLFGLIDFFQGYLPSSNNRWCTRLLKIAPLEDYLEKVFEENLYPGACIHTFVGLRADEPKRSGLNSEIDYLKTHFPLRDLGVIREDVFRIVAECGKIPSFYLHRTRSSCIACWGFRQSEIIGTLAYHPAEMAKAESFERLTDEDRSRYAIEGDDISGLNISYPVPSDLLLFKHMQKKRGHESVGKNRSKIIDDLFGEHIRIFVGVEFLQKPDIEYFYQKDRSCSSSTGCWWHNLVGWSTTRGGISRKLNNQFVYRLDTAEVFGLSQDELRGEYRQAVYLLEIPKHLIDIDPPTGTIKDPDGRIVDAGGNSILINGKPVFIRNRKLSKEERAEMRNQGVHSYTDLMVMDESGKPIDSPFTLDDLFAEPAAISGLKLIKHSEKLQRVMYGSSATVLLNGTVCYREKKGKIKKQGSFVWKRNEPISQVRQIATMVKRTLIVEGLRQEEKDYLPYKNEDSWEAEQYEAVVQKLSDIDFSYGSLIGMERFSPVEFRNTATQGDNIPCFACSK